MKTEWTACGWQGKWVVDGRMVEKDEMETLRYNTTQPQTEWKWKNCWIERVDGKESGIKGLNSKI